jgi:hypothetical protein
MGTAASGLGNRRLGLENLRNSYRRVRGLLEGFFEKKILASGHPRKIKGLRAFYWRQKPYEMRQITACNTTTRAVFLQA